METSLAVYKLRRKFVTNAEIARRLKVGPTRVQWWMTGGVTPRPEILEKIWLLLGVPPSDWFRRPLAKRRAA